MENTIAEIQVSYSSNMTKKEKITDSEKAYSILLNSWSLDLIELQEEFKVLLLNRANEVIGLFSMSKGGLSGTVVDVKLLFAVAIKCNASGIIIAHNHPSGNLKASEQDKKITKQIKEGAKIFDIQFLDHLIITKTGYLSFTNEGII